MKKITIYFCTHLFIVFSSALYYFIASQIPIEQVKEGSIPVLSTLNSFYNNSYLKPYMVLSGANAGYGFYGQRVATNKFFVLDEYDSNGLMVNRTNISESFKTKNGFSRFLTLTSRYYSFINDTENLKKDLPSNEYIISVRDKFADKIMHHLGKSMVDSMDRDKTYIVKLYTIIPPKSLKGHSENELFNVYVLDEYKFKN